MDNKQLILNLRTLPAMNRNDYFVNVTNSEAVEWVEMWPNWPYFGFIVCGSKRSGKSHLASVLKSVSKGKVIFAKNITENNIEEFFHINCLIIENFEQLVSENAFLHLFNMCKENNNKIMLTSAVSPPEIDFKLPDLKSRVLSLPSVELKFPDDELLENIILKQFLDRGVKVDKEVIEFLLKRVDRSFDSIYNLVSKIDFASMENSRKITIPFVKKFIKD